MSHLLLPVPLVGLWLLALPGFSQSPPAPPQLIEKERIVEAKPPPAAAWEPAEVGRHLVIREVVAARERSRAVIQISGDRLLRVNSKTQLVILPSLFGDKALGLELQKGEIYLHSREAGAGMTIQTPVTEAKPHGTQFRVLVEDNGTTTFTMFEGTVDLVNGFGKLTLGSHEQGIVEPGKAPRRTARIDAKNTIQWCLYYPGVLHLPELGLTQQEQRELTRSIAAYTTGDLLDALAAWPAEYIPHSASAQVFHAMVLLAVGQVADARTAMAGVPNDAPGRRAIEETIDAINFVERPNPHAPKSAGEWLARSYYEQSRSRLESALAAARKAAALAPDFGFAAVRVAELEFSFGRTRAAMEELTRGLRLAPRNAQAYALQGFMLSDWNCMAAARAAFESAIQLDSALGTAWLGRGLCDIRGGHQEAGRRDLQTATILEPNRSMFHAYLGKASAQVGLMKAAQDDLEYAKLLDPRDPTPWLYAALVDQEQYRPNHAIGELEKSIELNDNRRLYRSSMLLDQDRAVRSANLAKLYQYNGMRDVAVREATRAVESDYTNPSAHLFLANSFDVLRDPRRIELRHETPWFNELLLANLLGPVGGGPLSQYVSQGEYSRLLEADGTGGSVTQEWRSTSELRTTASVFGTYGRVSYGLDASYFNDNGDRLNSDAERTEIYGQFKWQVTPDDIFYFLGKWQDQKSGDNFETYDNQPLSPFMRFRETQEPGLLLAGWNHRWRPGSNTLFLGGRLSATQNLTDPRSTQLLLQRDPAAMYPDFVHKNGWFDEYTDPALQNAAPPAASLGPDGQSLIYSPALLRAIAPYVGSGQVTNVATALFDFATQRQFEIYSAELQHIEQGDHNTFLAGARWQGGEFDTDSRLSILRPTFAGGFSTPAADQHSVVDFQRTSLYAYDYWRPLSWLTLIGGVAWDRIEHPDNFRNPPVNDRQREAEQVSGKLGFTMTPSRWFNLRGAYSEGLGGVTFDESVRLEPSQVAGFSQAYRTILSESIAGSVEAPQFKTWGLGVDGALPSRTWWGAAFKVIGQDVDRTLGAFSGYDLGVFPNSPAYFPDGTPQQLAYRECAFSATLNQLLGEEFAVGLAYQATRSKLRTRYPELPVNAVLAPEVEDQATLHEVSVFGVWNSPGGFFARAEANWFCQNLDDDPRGLAAGASPRKGDAFWQFNAMLGYRFWRNQGEVSVGVLNLGDTDYRLSPLNPYGEIVRGRTAIVTCRLSF
ncbi:MAG: FecR domain-containing protein [Verrucomicrobiota bacterium]